MIDAAAAGHVAIDADPAAVFGFVEFAAAVAEGADDWLWHSYC